ncbi:lysoplasmalogenase [Nocardiopsis coralliicola]
MSPDIPPNGADEQSGSAVRPRPRRALRAAAAVFAAVAAAHLAGHLLGLAGWDRPTQVLLMPALALCVLAATRAPRPRTVRLLLAALAFSWLGDTLPGLAAEDTAFLLMVGGFLVAQAVYLAVFLPHRGASVLHRHRWALAPYAGFVALLVWLCAPHAGGLLVPVLLYGLLLGAMAVLATGLGPWTAAGGALFLVSDALIALGAFVPGFTLPSSGFWVMATYIAAQTLIAAGLLARAGALQLPGGSAPAPAAPAAPEK